MDRQVSIDKRGSREVDTLHVRAAMAMAASE